jgi:hypothetical protein
VPFHLAQLRPRGDDRARVSVDFRLIWEQAYKQGISDPL